jgi:hypothetical protein
MHPATGDNGEKYSVCSKYLINLCAVVALQRVYKWAAANGMTSACMTMSNDHASSSSDHATSSSRQ